MKRNCELCNSKAKMFCESDQASLCWDCDGKVHGANFLVAKHSRTLLCHLCQSPTPWIGSGPKLGPTISVCCNCGRKGSGLMSNEEMIDDHENEEDDSDDEENQVVPVPRSNSSTGEESSTRFCCNRAGDSVSVSQNRGSSSCSPDRGNVEK